MMECDHREKGKGKGQFLGISHLWIEVLDLLGPVQTSCFCRAELNSGIKFDKSTAEARRLNQTFELSSASN